MGENQCTFFKTDSLWYRSFLHDAQVLFYTQFHFLHQHKLTLFYLILHELLEVSWYSNKRMCENVCMHLFNLIYAWHKEKTHTDSQLTMFILFITREWLQISALGCLYFHFAFNKYVHHFVILFLHRCRV